MVSPILHRQLYCANIQIGHKTHTFKVKTSLNGVVDCVREELDGVEADEAHKVATLQCCLLVNLTPLVVEDVVSIGS